MRKQNRECLDPAFFDEVFSTADDLCLAMHDGDFPYVIPLNFVRQGNIIYIHCALEGHKLDCINRNPNVAFTLAADVRIHQEKSTTYYKSVCGTGRAVLVEDPAEKGRALDARGQQQRSRAIRHRPAISAGDPHGAPIGPRPFRALARHARAKARWQRDLHPPGLPALPARFREVSGGGGQRVARVI